MPLYEYRCKCGKITMEIRSFAKANKPVTCKCGGKTRKIISRPNLITDTNFGYTGKYDGRFGGPKIEGRQDFWRRVKNQGLKEVDLKELADRPQTMEKRLAKRLSTINAD